MAHNAQRVLRTVYVDPDVDDQLRDEAASSGVDQADLFRRWLGLGVKTAKARPSTLDALQLRHDRPLVLRSVYLDTKLDDQLRVRAFDQGTSMSDLIRSYVRLGLERVPVGVSAATR